jgi:hypothetical protein
MPHALKPGSHTGITSEGAHDGVGGDGGTDAGAHGDAHGGGAMYQGGGGIGRPNVAGGGGGGGLHSFGHRIPRPQRLTRDELASGAASITIVNAANASTRTVARRQTIFRIAEPSQGADYSRLVAKAAASLAIPFTLYNACAKLGPPTGAPLQIVSSGTHKSMVLGT